MRARWACFALMLAAATGLAAVLPKRALLKTLYRPARAASQGRLHSMSAEQQAAQAAARCAACLRQATGQPRGPGAALIAR